MLRPRNFNRRQVIHNLDLYVISDQTGVISFPNGLRGFDNINNVEKVRIANPRPGDVLTVYVRGTSITLASTQRYALVASGTFVKGAWYCQVRVDAPPDDTQPCRNRLRHDPF